MRIADYVRELRVAAEASSLPTISAAATAVRTVGEIGPILSARAGLFAAEGSGVVNSAGLDLLSRPYVRADVRRAVEDAALKTPDGRFYFS
jgi:outer membrane protein TolC